METTKNPAATPADRLKILEGEVVAIKNSLFLADAALEDGTGWDLRQVAGAVQAELLNLRLRLGDVSEELETLANESERAKAGAA